MARVDWRQLGPRFLSLFLSLSLRSSSIAAIKIHSNPRAESKLPVSIKEGEGGRQRHLAAPMRNSPAESMEGQTARVSVGNVDQDVDLALLHRSLPLPLLPLLSLSLPLLRFIAVADLRSQRRFSARDYYSGLMLASIKLAPPPPPPPPPPRAPWLPLLDEG